MKPLKAFMPSGLFTDFLILAGLGMLFYGLHLVAPWLAYAVIGTLVLIIGVVMK
jgi:hypothetical protein